MAELAEILKGEQLFNAQSGSKQVRVASIREGFCTLASYNRRDFYKITLILSGNYRLLYASRDIEVSAPSLIFTNPLVPYSWDGHEDEIEGYFCVFQEDFLTAAGRTESLQESSLFKAGGEPVYKLNNEQAAFLENIFQRMRNEIDSDYVFKYELIRSQVNLMIHEAIKMQPAQKFDAHQNASSRIVRLFMELLDRQFPVDSPQFIMKLKKPADYADKLAVHVNHLNAAMQEVTGKSTTTHINEKILAEAKSLLTFTDWSVADIAASLGFDYSSYFNNFFKKHLGLTPLALRKSL